ncbi:MAG: pilus assembly protein PilM [bacterium]|nr:pilus assembly protein PilM [bacterium]
MADRRILSVDWDPRELRLVHARIRKEQVCIDDVLSVKMPDNIDLTSAEQLGQLLRQVLHHERIRCNHVIVDIPRDQVVLNTLTLPNVAVGDMAGMVELQIAKGLPFPVSEAVVDFAVPPDDDGGDQYDVPVGAVRKEVVAFYEQVCHNAGLKLERIGLRPYANKVAIGALLAGQTPERVLIVDVGPTLTEIDVLRRGQLVFSRAASVFVPPDIGKAVPLSSVDVARSGVISLPDEDEGEVEAEVIPFDAEIETGHRDLTAVVTDLMVEVTRSIEAYRGTDLGAEMDCVVVAGGTGIEERLAEAMQRRFGVHTETYNPTAILDGDRDRGAEAVGFSAALGLVLGHAGEGRLHFDFLHPKKQEAPGRAQLKKVPLVAAVVAVFVLFGGVLYTKGPAKKFAQIRALEEEIADTKARIKDNQPFIRMVGAAEKFEAEQIVWVDEMRSLVALLPDNKKVVLEQLHMVQRDRRIKFGLRAKDGSQGATIVEQLEAYRPEGQEKPHYSAQRGPTGRAAKGDYRYDSNVTVRIVDGPGASTKGKRRGG